MTPQELYETTISGIVKVVRVDPDGSQQGHGSGFFLSRDGLVVTNRHVIEGARGIEVHTSNGAVFRGARVLAIHAIRDVALLGVVGQRLSTLALSLGVPAPGIMVAAIGCPLGYDFVISTGVVSQYHRIDARGPMIQTTTPISPGSSGGPLIDMFGGVLGITTQTHSHDRQQNVNFAEPATAIDELVRGLGPRVDVRALLEAIPDAEVAAQDPAFEHGVAAFLTGAAVPLNSTNHRRAGSWWSGLKGLFPATGDAQFAMRSFLSNFGVSWDRAKALEISEQRAMLCDVVARCPVEVQRRFWVGVSVSAALNFLVEGRILPLVEVDRFLIYRDPIAGGTKGFSLSYDRKDLLGWLEADLQQWGWPTERVSDLTAMLQETYSKWLAKVAAILDERRLPPAKLDAGSQTESMQEHERYRAIFNSLPAIPAAEYLAAVNGIRFGTDDFIFQLNVVDTLESARKRLAQNEALVND